MKKNAAISNRGVAATKKAKQKEPYLTKRILVSAAKRGIREAADETMRIMGYVVIAKGGWVVKKYANGDIEKIVKIDSQNVTPLD